MPLGQLAKLGSFAGRAISGAGGLGGLIGAFSGGTSRGAAGAPLRQWTGQTRMLQGAPATGGRQFTPTAPGRGRYDTGPGRPGSTAFANRSFGGGQGGGVATGSWQDTFAQMQADTQARVQKYQTDQSNRANVEAYNKAFAEAKTANESRYQQLLGIADQTTQQRAKDISTDFEQRQAGSMQNLARLGLSGTSGASVISGGFGRKKSEALDRLADQMQQTKLGIIERRQDQYPDLTSMASLGRLGISGLRF